MGMTITNQNNIYDETKCKWIWKILANIQFRIFYCGASYL